MKFLNMKWVLLSLLIFNGQLVFSQDSLSIGLNASIALASQNNTNIIISDDQVNSSKFALKEAKAYFYIPTAPYSIKIGFGFTALVGIASGYFPAIKAAKLNPIDALRYE